MSSLEQFWFGNLKRSWLLCFALNLFFALGNVVLILISPSMVLHTVAGLINGALAIFSLYKWSIIE